VVCALPRVSVLSWSVHCRVSGRYKCTVGFGTLCCAGSVSGRYAVPGSVLSWSVHCGCPCPVSVPSVGAQCTAVVRAQERGLCTVACRDAINAWSVSGRCLCTAACRDDPRHRLRQWHSCIRVRRKRFFRPCRDDPRHRLRQWHSCIRVRRKRFFRPAPPAS
jgi:hypothetical protein